MPKVSVIIPVYNVEKYLERSLNSLSKQTLNDIEIICIDDCSKDNSLEILRKFENTDSRFKIVALSENKGAAYARNMGLKIATGEYLGFIDPDDDIDLNYYEELYKKAKEDDADIVKCQRKTINLDGTEIVSNKNNHILSKGKFEFSYEWTTAIYKKSMLDDNNICFPVECRKAQDIVFLTRCILVTNKLSLIDNVYYYYYKREGSLNAASIPLSSIKSALAACNLILDEINKSTLFEDDIKEYIRVYNSYLFSKFYTFFQNKSIYAKYLCVKNMIDSYHKCRDIILLRKNFSSKFKWMLPYFENNKPLQLTLLLLPCKHSRNLKIKQTFWGYIFSCRNIDVHKVVTILGLKIKFKSQKLVQRVK